MPLRAGENTLTARAQNAAGTWSGWSAPVVVTVPVQPPLISVGIAPDLAGLGTMLQLTATARGDGDVAPAATVVARPRERRVLASLNKITPGGLVGSWQVSKVADTDWCATRGFCLDELIFAGTDTLGNTGLATTTLTLDYLPPDAPQIDSPRASTWIQTESAWVRGHVFEPLLTVVLTGGATTITVTAQADGGWEAWVPLIEGVNTLMATAYDGLGNASTPTPYSQVKLRRDTQPPVVTTTSAIYTRQGTAFVVSATVSDAGLVNLAMADTDHPQVGANVPLGAWNVDEATINQTRVWQRAVGPVSMDGVFSATVRAMDAAGYTGFSGPQVLIVDSVRPTLTVTQLAATTPYGWSALTPTPKVWYGLGMGMFTVTVQAGDSLAGLDTLSWPATTSDGGPVIYGGAMGVAAEWSYTFSEASHFNQLAALSVNDRSGNGHVAGVQVLRDVTAPTVLGFSAPIKTYGEPAVVRWNAVDDGAGVRGYDLSVLIDGITQTQVLTQSTATSYAAGVLPSTHFYEWQLVVWDHVNNAVTRTATTAGVQTTKTYYFGASRVAVREAGVLSYLHSDQLSSVSASTDANGKVVGRQLFEPFGAVRATFGEVNGSWGWATHRKMEDTGLTFMRARWYAPGLGRFVSPDSIVPGPSEPQLLNRYSYVYNRPLNLVDPTGHDGEEPDKKRNDFCLLFCQSDAQPQPVLTVNQSEEVEPVVVPGPGGTAMAQGSGGFRQKVRDFGDTIGMKYGCQGLAFLLCSEAARKTLEEASKGDTTNKVAAVQNFGKAAEDIVRQKIGGTGAFRAGGREFDTSVGNTWIEIKSGLADITDQRWAATQSQIGQQFRIASDNAKQFELHIVGEVPQYVKEWLIKKGITFVEHGK